MWGRVRVLMFLFVLGGCGSDSSESGGAGGGHTGAGGSTGTGEASEISGCLWLCDEHPEPAMLCHCARRYDETYGCIEQRAVNEDGLPVDSCPLTPCCTVTQVYHADYRQTVEACMCTDRTPEECQAAAQEYESSRVVDSGPPG